MPENFPYERFKIRWEEVEPGDWFLPLETKGEDQHPHIPRAVARGAIGYSYEPDRWNENWLQGVAAEPVGSLRDLLFSLARGKRKLLRPRLAVVAGSAGKTSVKEMVAAVLRAALGRSFTGPVHSSPANLNTKLHLASQILKMPRDCAAAVFEVGARRVGDFSVPLSFLQPEVVALLNIGRAHAGEFGSLEALRATKLSVLRHEGAKALVVPQDEAILAVARAQPARVWTFGRGEGATVRIVAEDRELLLAENGVEYALARREMPAWSENAAAAAAIARALGISWAEIQAGFGAVTATPGRFERRLWQGKTVVDDAFNASPESVRLGLEFFFRQYPRERKIVVLGSMLELGAESASAHRSVIDWLGTRSEPFLLFTLGEEYRGLAAGRHFGSAAEVEAALREAKEKWDVAYLKGSRATGLLGLLA